MLLVCSGFGGQIIQPSTLYSDWLVITSIREFFNRAYPAWKGRRKCTCEQLPVTLMPGESQYSAYAGLMNGEGTISIVAQLKVFLWSCWDYLTSTARIHRRSQAPYMSSVCILVVAVQFA